MAFVNAIVTRAVQYRNPDGKVINMTFRVEVTDSDYEQKFIDDYQLYEHQLEAILILNPPARKNAFNRILGRRVGKAYRRWLTDVASNWPKTPIEWDAATIDSEIGIMTRLGGAD